jgi:hypothetical protein
MLYGDIETGVGCRPGRKRSPKLFAGKTFNRNKWFIHSAIAIAAT